MQTLAGFLTSDTTGGFVKPADICYVAGQAKVQNPKQINNAKGKTKRNNRAWCQGHQMASF